MLLLKLSKVYGIWSCDGVRGKNYPNEEFLITWPYQSWTWSCCGSISWFSRTSICSSYLDILVWYLYALSMMGCPVLQENTIRQLSITLPSILPANANTMIDQDSPVPTAGREPWQGEPMEKIWLDHQGGTQPTHHGSGGRRSDFLDCGAQGSTGRNLYIAASSESHLSSSPHSKMRAQIWVGARI